MKCKKCGYELEYGTKFCPQCGEKVKAYCYKCNMELPEGGKFCPSCGTPVSENIAKTGKNTVDIVLKNIGEDKAEIIKIISESTGWDLKKTKQEIAALQTESKVIIRGIPQEKIEDTVKSLRQGGAVFEIVESNIDDNKINPEKNRAVKGTEKEKDDNITRLTDDDYRNGLVKPAKILNIGYLISGLICLIMAWKFRMFYGWKGGILGFISSLLAVSIITWILGAEKYFGEARIRRYDKIKKASSKDAAVVAMENKKGGGIRITLIALMLTVGTITVSNAFCKALAESMVDDYLADKGHIDVDNVKDAGNLTEASSSAHRDIQTENFRVGETVQTDKFEFIVKNAYVLDDLGETKKIPEGAVYIVIEYEYKNISGQPIDSWDLPTIKLQDGNGAVYNQDADADWYFSQYSDAKIISDMNPGIKAKDSDIFEVAIDVLNQGGMKAYIKADLDFLIDLDLSYDTATNYGNSSMYSSNSENDSYSSYAEPETEYYDGLTVESVGNTAYSSNSAGVLMEIGTYSGTGAVYINFSSGGQIIWGGDLNRKQALENGGICLMFNGTNYITGEEDYLEVEWNSAEAIDFPVVNYEFDNIGISGSYSYSYMLEEN